MTMLTSAARRRRAALLPIAAALGFALLAISEPAHAAVPGTNGLIAYVSDGRPVIAPSTPNDDIYVTTENGTSDLRLRLTSDSALDRQPAVSPNGKEIAFFSTRAHGDPLNPERDSELYVMDATDDDGDGQGDNLRRLTDNPASDFAPAWSPDGKKLAFTSNRDGNNEIYLIDADVCDASAPPNPDCPDPEVTRVTNNPASDQVPVFSPDGAKMAFQSARDGNQEIYVINADGSGEPTNLTNNPALDSLPDFSPDGTGLTFGSTRDGGDVDVWTMNADGSDPVNLTPTLTATNDRWSAWSPAGDKIVFWSGIGNGLGTDAEIYTVTTDGTGTLANLTHDLAGGAEPDWGPAPVKKAGKRAHSRQAEEMGNSDVQLRASGRRGGWFSLL
jgi:Tol biopolymer transport system component